MQMLLWVIGPIGKILISIILLAVLLIAAWFAWAAWVRWRIKHEPIEYYSGWGGYWHPIGLSGKISKEEADILEAKGSAYLIARYNGRKLTRVTKMLKGAVFFDFEYTYHANGRCSVVKTTNAKGVVKVREYDRRGRALPNNPGGFW